jgi:hypothetical protein
MDWMKFVSRYPNAQEARKRTEEAVEEKKRQERKDHYDAVFEEILAAAQRGDTCVRLESYQIEEYGMRLHLESKGYEIGKPFSRHSNLAGTFHYVHWGEKKEDTDETV